jgi:hypothetical protein
MTPLLTVPVQGYEVCRPAAGTRAAFNSQDFGTSHWQLMIDGYTSFTRLQKGPQWPVLALRVKMMGRSVLVRIWGSSGSNAIVAAGVAACLPMTPSRHRPD